LTLTPPVRRRRATAAERALEQLNYTKINDKPIRLMWSHRDPNTRKNNAANIFIKVRRCCSVARDSARTRTSRTRASRAPAARIRAAPLEVHTTRPAAPTMRRILGRAALALHAPRAHAAAAARRRRRPPAPNPTAHVFATPPSRRTRALTRFPCLPACRCRPPRPRCAAQNLDESIDTKALHDTFEAFGKIVSAKVTVGPDGKSRGFGFIQFDTPEAAATAIEKVNGMQIENRKVFVGPFQKKAERGGDGQSKFTNIFVKNMAPETDEAALKTMFDAYGPTTSIAVMRGEDGVSKGFGFVSFAEAEHAAAAVAGHNGKEVGGKALFVGRAQKKGERDALLRERFEAAREERIQKFSGMNLFVKNLDDTVDDDKLREEFGAYGTIASAKVMRDDKGVSKGFGFVCFSTPEEATKAVTEASGRMLAGKPIYVALHQRKELRKAQLEAAYAQRLALGARGMAPPGSMGPGGPMGGMYPPGAPLIYGAMAPMPPGARGPMMYGGGPMMGGPGGPRGGPYRGGPMPGPRPGYAPMPPGAFVLGPNGLPQAPGGGRPGAPRGAGGPGGPGGPGGVRAGPGAGGKPQGMMMNGGGMPQGGMGMQNGGGMKAPNGVPLGAKGPGGAPGGAPRGAPPAAGAPVKQGYAGAAARPAAPPAPGVVPTAGGAEVLTTATLASASPEQQKQLLGERLFPQVAALQPDLAGKITGMLLEMDNGELLLLLESHDALAAKVDEAIQVLRQHAVIA
jgi:polyadenylate-binding protein